MGIAETRGTQARNRKPIVCRSRTGIENDMARLGPKCTGCCVRLNTCNAVTNDTHTQHTHAHTHTHTHTHHNHSSKMKNIKSFVISIFKKLKL